jgi:hypothetical protein
LGAPLASTCAARIASTATETAVSKPKVRSIKGRSLSIVLGMPIDRDRELAPLFDLFDEID